MSPICPLEWNSRIEGNRNIWDTMEFNKDNCYEFRFVFCQVLPALGSRWQEVKRWLHLACTVVCGMLWSWRCAFVYLSVCRTKYDVPATFSLLVYVWFDTRDLRSFEKGRWDVRFREPIFVQPFPAIGRQSSSPTSCLREWHFPPSLSRLRLNRFIYLPSQVQWRTFLLTLSGIK